MLHIYSTQPNHFCSHSVVFFRLILRNRVAPATTDLLPYLVTSYGTDDHTAENTIKSNLQLCYLQLTQAIPTAINYASFAVREFGFDISSSAPGWTSGSDLPRLVQQLDTVYRFWHLQLFVNISNVMAHCTHFYLYILFSARFREEFAYRARLIIENVFAY
jgi:hypothetical protein